MKNHFYLLVLLSSFSACEVLEETTVKSEIHFTEFEELRLNNDLVDIELDSFKNFAELREEYDILFTRLDPTSIPPPPPNPGTD